MVVHKGKAGQTVPVQSLQSSWRQEHKQADHGSMSTTNNYGTDRMERRSAVLEWRAAQRRKVGLMASQKKVNFELGVEASDEHRLTPGSLCLTSLIPSILCKTGGNQACFLLRLDEWN